MRRLVRIGFVLAAVTLFAASCGEDRGPTRPVTPTVVLDSLVFTRPDSTVMVMGTTPFACCGPYDPSFVNEPAIRIVLYDPASQKPGWQILILTERAQQGETVSLPTTVVPPSKIPRISMFVADMETGNELSSDTEESTGTITVHAFYCDGKSIRIDFSVNATLGSEFSDGPTVNVVGHFQGSFPATTCL